MSTMKRSSGKDYRRLAQTADSDEEVALFSLSPSSTPLPPSTTTTTTEFGNGRYDKSRDLELPEAPLAPRRGRERRLEPAVRLKKGLGWRASRETRLCLCFLGLLAAAMIVVVLAWFQLSNYTGAKPASSPSPQFSIVVQSYTSTPFFVSPSPLTHPTPTETEPPTATEEPQTATEQPTTATEEQQTATATTEEPQTATEQPTTATEEPQTATATTEEPQTATEQPTTATGEPLSPNKEKRNISWRRDFFPAITETALQLRDVSGDGVSDVVMVEGRGQCDMVLRVLDGFTGRSVWDANISYDAFAVRCEVDLDGDGLVDCVAAGRQSGFCALSGSNGSVLWDRDPRLAFSQYNYYFPLFVPDLDRDGVQDIIITHGGDSTYRDSDTERSTGFLQAVSGRTGQQLMNRVPLPDGHETYNSPVYLSRGGEERDVILVGTGGETLPGSLWAFGYSSLQQRIAHYLSIQGQTNYTPFTGYVNHPCKRDVSEEEIEKDRPTFDPGSFDTSRDTSTDPVFSGCRMWGPHKPVWNKFGLCVYRLVSGDKKGVLLPPVVVEMTGDEQSDLVVSLFEGKTLVINGETGEVVWEAVIPGTESYSVPAPLYFNSDTVPDLLVRINHGEWDAYNHSTVAVLDGQSGQALWSFGSVKTGMMSGLSLAATQPGADAAVFITMGTIQNNNNNSSTVQARAVLEEVVRETRHTGPHDDVTQVIGESEEEEEEEDDDELAETDGEPQVDEFMTSALSYRDPPGLWEGAGHEFPDPEHDLSTFLLDYCGWQEEELTASLYILTLQQALSSPTPPPLFSSGPFVYFPGYREKRHSGAHVPTSPSHNSSSSNREHWKELRCSHIMIPEMIVSTPAIGDINEDGQLEIAYLVSWKSNSGGSGEIPIQDLPPRFTVFVETLAGRVREVMGEEEGERWLGGFLPGGQQPWTHYMGARGDNTYLRPTP